MKGKGEYKRKVERNKEKGEEKGKGKKRKGRKRGKEKGERGGKGNAEKERWEKRKFKKSVYVKKKNRS
jgi:hypothetical protein